MKNIPARSYFSSEDCVRPQTEFLIGEICPLLALSIIRQLFPRCRKEENGVYC